MNESMQVIDVDALKHLVRNAQKNSANILRAKHKLAILERDGFKCVSCNNTEDLTIDHFGRPTREKMNNASWYNPKYCKTLCIKCHTKKNALTNNNGKYRYIEDSNIKNE